MRVSKEQMAESRSFILDAAKRLFRERGFDGVTVAEVMQAAGLTHGAFYGHFKSKEDLIAHALETAVDEIAESAASANSIEAYASRYLSKRHRENLAGGCVYAALSSEVARLSLECRQVLTDGLKAQLDALSAKAPGRTSEAKRQRAVTAWSAMVGALLLSRVVAEKSLSDEILERTRLAIAR